MKLGIDIGLSNVHVVGLVANKKVLSDWFPLRPSFSLAAYLDQFGQVSSIAFTGNQRYYKKSYRGIPIKYKHPIDAMGKGGLITSAKTKGLVVSCGTGTCLIDARDTYTHIGGSSLGGGTLAGLSETLLGPNAPLERLAGNGKIRNVDFTLADLHQPKLGFLKPSSSVSHLARLKHARKADKALGILTMVGQTIANLAVLGAKAADQNTIIFTGGVITYPTVRSVIRKRIVLIDSKKTIIFAQDPLLATAEGCL